MQQHKECNNYTILCMCVHAYFLFYNSIIIKLVILWQKSQTIVGIFMSQRFITQHPRVLGYLHPIL